VVDLDRSRVRYEGSSGGAPRLQRPLFHSVPACVSSIAAAARHGWGGSCRLRRAGWPALTQPRTNPGLKARKAGWRAIRPSRSDDGEAPEGPVTAPAGKQGGEVGPAARGEGSLQAPQRQHRPGRLPLSRGWSGDPPGCGAKKQPGGGTARPQSGSGRLSDATRHTSNVFACNATKPTCRRNQRSSSVLGEATGNLKSRIPG
jgi:hypothetical protein